jgi:NitT/TauT family transport system substrate-binding protein
MSATSARTVRPLCTALTLAALMVLSGAAFAADTLRVGRPAPAFPFTPLDIGMKEGFFQKHGVELEITTFSGGAKLMQGLVAGAIDISVGSGSDFAFILKGVPMTAIAAVAGPPNLFGLTVLYDSPIKTVDDLRGKKIGVATFNAMTHWLALELARQKEWGPGGVVPIPIGTDPAAQYAALKTHEIDADLAASALGFQLEEKKQGRLLLPVSDYLGDVVIHMISATNAIIAANPDALSRFMAGWFDTIAFMRANKAETVAQAREVTGYDAAVESREYDLCIAMFSSTGRFTPQALKNLGELLSDNNAVPEGTDFTKMLTERFLPKP